MFTFSLNILRRKGYVLSCLLYIVTFSKHKRNTFSVYNRRKIISLTSNTKSYIKCAISYWVGIVSEGSQVPRSWENYHPTTIGSCTVIEGHHTYTQLKLIHKFVLFALFINLIWSQDLPGIVAFLNSRFVNEPGLAQKYAHAKVPGSYGPGYEEDLRQFTLKKVRRYF